MNKKYSIAPLVLAAGLTTLPAAAHEEQVADGDGHLAESINLLHHAGGTDGHVPPNTNYGFEVIGHDTLGGIADGKYTDVWASEGFAYVGTFQEPSCDRSGVYISDIRDPANPATVGMIKSPPKTRINDVKTHWIGDRNVLFFTLEPCGKIVGNGSQQGQGGISLWDVTDPTKPHALKQNFLDFPVHNTFPWTTETGNTYLMVVDDVNLDDTHIIDITKPQSPKLITTTGIAHWADQGALDDGQGAMGVFAASLLHDIWVQNVGGRWLAVLSYWDAGFIVLDVTDPYNPVFQGDSTYPDPDPALGISPPEGNAHAAVFGGDNGEYIFAGDEDFDTHKVTIKAGGETFNATQGSDVPQIGTGVSVSGDTVYVGLACTAAGVPPAPTGDAIAIIQRGDCAFTDKAQNIEAAGYAAGIVFNHTTGCEETVSMLVQAGVPMLFVPRSAGFGILGIGGYDSSQCGGGSDGTNPALPAAGTAGLFAEISADFDGWGYFHLLDTHSLTQLGYYAPAEVADPDKATGFGDLTMHNVEVDPLQRNRAFISWYSLGMRAIEYRPGHLHTGGPEGIISENVHEVGRFIADDGSNFWGVHVTEVGGEQYVLGSDRSTGLWIFKFTCTGPAADNPALYCITP